MSGIEDIVGGPKIMKSGRLKAVHDDDLIQFLKSLGVYEAVISNSAKCYICNSVVSLDSIVAVFPLNGEVAFCCSKIDCYQKLMHMGGI